MKKIFCLLILLLLLPLTSYAASNSSGMFKLSMHKIFQSYNHARISISLRKFDITNIYLENLNEAIAEAEKNIPEKNRDGSKLDKEVVQNNMDKFKKIVANLRAAVKRGDPLTTKIYSMDLFNMCVHCHQGVKFDNLFIPPKRATLFGEYMHNISEHIDLAWIESDDDIIEASNKHLKLVNYYLDLLVDVIPDVGPSGVIMDKAAFKNRIAETKGIIKEVSKGKDTIEVEALRKPLNSLCIACHEPERIK